MKTPKTDKIIEAIKISYIENDSLDDFLELLQDHGMLSVRGLAMRKVIWEHTEKGKEHQDPYLKAWEGLSKYSKEYVTKEALAGKTNKRSLDFILSLRNSPST